MRVPSCVNKHRLALEIQSMEYGILNFAVSGGWTNNNAIQVGKGSEKEFGHIFSIAETMEGAIKISSRVCNHFDLADLEFRPLGVMTPGILAAQKITDKGSWQAPVRFISITSL